MSNRIYSPQVNHYLSWLGRHSFSDYNSNFGYDEKTRKAIDELFEAIHQIAPNCKNGGRCFWVRADRGPIEAFGDFQEMLDYEVVDSYEEYENLWKLENPYEEMWYELIAVEDDRSEYKVVVLNNKVVVQIDDRTDESYPNDIAEFAEWLRDSVLEVIEELKAGVYMQKVNAAIPVEMKTGTVLRKHLWDVFPEEREEFFAPISKEDVAEFIRLASKQNEEGNIQELYRNAIPRMTANEFFRLCSLGYKANNYKGCDLSPKEQYFLHADGRDEGLGEIEPNSPEAFAEWLTSRSHGGGHPWEVCRGGNSTHVDFRVVKVEGGYVLYLAGDSWGRTIETVNFYMALHREGLPVFIHESETLVARLTEKEKIGIVPQGVIPAYCESRFPDEHIICFMNLPDEGLDKLLPFCEWQPLDEVKLNENPEKENPLDE